MKPIETPACNITLVGAEGDDHVLPLPAFTADGETISQWKLEGEDLAKLNEGGQVALGVASNPPPPMGLAVVGPYCETCEERMGWSERFQTYLCPHAEDDPTAEVS